MRKNFKLHQVVAHDGRISTFRINPRCIIFTYEFKKASDAFTAENCKLNTLSNYSVLIETALKTGYIGQEEVETLKKWRLDPAVWGLGMKIQEIR